MPKDINKICVHINIHHKAKIYSETMGFTSGNDFIIHINVATTFHKNTSHNDLSQRYIYQILSEKTGYITFYKQQASQ